MTSKVTWPFSTLSKRSFLSQCCDFFDTRFGDQKISRLLSCDLAFGKPTDFSVILDVNCKLLTGRKVLIDGSPAFLRKGCPDVFFQSSTKTPDPRDSLTVL